MAFAAIREFLKLQGMKYLAPAKAGVLASEMEQYRALAQAARKEFTDLVSAFQKRHPYLEQDRTSQWMNQAQILRPHFWAYLKGEGTVRKVLVKYDVSLVEESSLENILDQLQEALVALEPYYLATRQV